MPVVQRDTFRLEDGLDLVVSKNLKTFQRNAVLQLAVTRMKKLLDHKGKVPRGNELFCAIFEHLVEETIIKTTVSWYSKRQTFRRADSETEGPLSDPDDKSLVLVGGQGSESEKMKLQAICLKGGYDDHKVNFKLSRYETTTSQGGQTVVLSINKYQLSSSMKEDKAELILEKCSQEDLEKIGNEASMNRFLFWKKTEATELKFESVSCPGWFISTSTECGKPVDMCRADDQRYMCLRTA
ncbi:interleukin-1 beta isoform X2 [Halichoeres trimaculatus]